MGANSGISWTDHTFNPWWGCVRVSPGCDMCYAEEWDKRFGPSHWGGFASRRFFGDKHWNEPLKLDRKAKQEGKIARIFCASMSDVCEILPFGHPQIEEMKAARLRLCELIRNTPNLEWLMLTKRPENIVALFGYPDMLLDEFGQWAPNVRWGTTTENQLFADRRLPALIATGCKNFVSYEPAIEMVNFMPWIDKLDWLICGGESGKDARPFKLEWAQLILAQCDVSNKARMGCVPFIKQLGSNAFFNGLPFKTKNHKGDDPTEWPQELQVQRFPEGRP